MENFGGKSCLADNRSTTGYNTVASRALAKQERWLDKVSEDSKRHFSREEAKIRKNLERLNHEKYFSKSKTMLYGADHSPGLSRLGSNISKYDEGHTHTEVHHHQHSGHHLIPHQQQQVHSNQSIARTLRGRPSHTDHQKDKSHHKLDQAVHIQHGIHKDHQKSLTEHKKDSLPNVHQNKHHRRHQTSSHEKPTHPIQKTDQHDSQHRHHAGPEIHGKNHQDLHHVQSNESAKKYVKLPSISTKNTATGSGHHVPLTKIHVEDFDDHNETGSPKGSHTQVNKYHMASKSIKALYDEAIQRVKSDDSSPRSSDHLTTGSDQFESKRLKAEMEKFDLDLEAFRELEGIIKDAKHNSSKKDTGTCNPNFSNRHQKRRLQHLEQLLEELRPRIKPDVKFDPSSILECRYLRLSKANIENLEKLVRESGKDPGIHAHSDVTDYNIWKKD